MRQLELFEATEQTRTYWEMSRSGIAEAADVLTQLLREDLMTTTVTFSQIVKKKMGLTGDSVPDHLARTFADAVEAVTEERLAIKEQVEEFGEFRLCVVDESGRSAVRAGRLPASGFALRGSAVGLADDNAQLKMSLGKVHRIVKERVPDALPMLQSVEERLLGDVFNEVGRQRGT